jgi:hypothetical protein
MVTINGLTFFMKGDEQVLTALWKKRTSFLVSFIKFISRRDDFIIKSTKNRKAAT